MARRAAAAALTLLCLAPMAPAQEVTFTLGAGAEATLEDVLRAASFLLAEIAAGDVDAQDLVAAARADYRALLTGLYAGGHYGSTISIRLDGREAAAIQPLDAPARVDRVEIVVDPGPRFSFGRAEVAPLPPGAALPAEFATGAVAGAETVREAARAAVLAWRDLGHARAAPAGQDLRADHAARVLDVAVQIDPGPRLRFGPVTVEGAEAVRPERIVEIAGLPEGRTFRPADMDLAASRLRRSGAFASVALSEGESILPPDLLPIGIAVSEMAPRRLGFGAELSSSDGLALSAFWLHRNLLGGAERFRAEAEVTGIEGQSGGPDAAITLTFGRPATFGADADLTAELGFLYLDEPDYRLWLLSAEAGLVRYVSDSLTYELGLGFLTAHEETAVRTRDYTLLTAPLGATLDRRSDPFDPTAGFYIDLDLTPFVGLAESDSGLRLHADARAYRSFGADDRVTLAARLQAGAVLGAGLLDTPADFLFYSGGGDTVRGQPYQSLGIEISRDFGNGLASLRSGGRLFLGAQAEARVQLSPKLEIVGFTDWGLIDAEPRPTDQARWHGGAGLGLRYATPIGPVRVDLATPVTGDRAGRDVELYIGLGQAF